MKLIKKVGIVSSAPMLGLAFLILSSTAQAATSPGLGAASTFSILSSSYINSVAGTTINGDLGYTVGPAVVPTVSGTTHVANSTYNQAGIDQGAALVALNNQACDFNFAPGSIDLATDTTHGPIGVYTPGVYCVTGAASIGTAGVTLNGAGSYIFRMDGALTSVANSAVTLTGGASACDVWWTPTAATTLGANSIFAGTDVSAAGITIGNLTAWTGRALAFGGTVTTSRNTINTIPNCSATSNPSTGEPTEPGTGTGTGTGASATPGLPNTGSDPQINQTLLFWSIPVVLLIASLLVLRTRRKSLNHG